MKRGTRRYLWVALSCALAYPATASAAPTASDKAAAQALFEDAIRLMANKSYEEACRKLEESQRLDGAMGTRYQLSQCYEAIGRTASAWAGFVEVADLARAAGQEGREKAARERAASLEPKVARLVIDVATPDVAGLEVRRDGVVLGPAQWGAAIPVDPGSHRVTASAPAKAPWTSDVTVSGTGDTIRLRVPSLAGVPVPGPAPTEAASPPPKVPSSPVETSHGTGQRTLGIVTTAAGAVGVGTGVVLGLVARSDYASAGSHCSAGGCDAQGKDTTDSARRLGNVGTVVFAAGSVLAAVGAVVWLTAPSAAPSRAIGVRVTPRAIMLDGSF